MLGRIQPATDTATDSRRRATERPPGATLGGLLIGLDPEGGLGMDAGAGFEPATSGL